METENFNPWAEEYQGQHNLNPVPTEAEPATEEERLRQEIATIEEHNKELTLLGRTTPDDRRILRENDERLRFLRLQLSDIIHKKPRGRKPDSEDQSNAV